MPSQRPDSRAEEAPSVTSYGQVIEYIQGTTHHSKHLRPSTWTVPRSPCPLLTCISFRTQTACIWLRTPTRQTITHLSRTHPNNLDRPRRGRQEQRLQDRRQCPSSRDCSPSTSPSTAACCTTLSTPISAHYTLATCTASPCSCTMFWDSKKATTDRLCSGVLPTRGVCKHGFCGNRIAIANEFLLQAAPMPHVSLPPIWCSFRTGRLIWRLRQSHKWIRPACRSATQDTAKRTTR